MHLLEKNSRLEEAEEQINYLEDKVMESNQTQQRRRKLFQMRAVLGNSVTSSDTSSAL